MSTMNPFDELAVDGKVREGAESLALRNDELGAMARIGIDLADGNRPNENDLKQLGMENTLKLLQEAEK